MHLMMAKDERSSGVYHIFHRVLLTLQVLISVNKLSSTLVKKYTISRDMVISEISLSVKTNKN